VHRSYATQGLQWPHGGSAQSRWGCYGSGCTVNANLEDAWGLGTSHGLCHRPPLPTCHPRRAPDRERSQRAAAGRGARAAPPTGRNDGQKGREMAKDILCTFGTDIDSVAGQIGS
jgi:hypothetical protein